MFTIFLFIRLILSNFCWVFFPINNILGVLMAYFEVLVPLCLELSFFLFLILFTEIFFFPFVWCFCQDVATCCFFFLCNITNLFLATSAGMMSHWQHFFFTLRYKDPYLWNQVVNKFIVFVNSFAENKFSFFLCKSQKHKFHYTLFYILQDCSAVIISI